MTGGAHPLEVALGVATRWALVGSSLAVLLLLIPADVISRNRLVVFTAHLVLLVVSASMLAVQLEPLLRTPWFGERRRSLLLSAITLVALVTGYVALVTLATSAGLRYDPSLQFLQLLSALDVAWTASALVFGVALMSGSRRSSLIAALVLDAVCVMSIWNYLRVVGFDDIGGWIVSERELLVLVIPFDIAAAAMAVGALLRGSRRQSVTNSGAE